MNKAHRHTSWRKARQATAFKEARRLGMPHVDSAMARATWEPDTVHRLLYTFLAWAHQVRKPGQSEVSWRKEIKKMVSA